MADRQSLISPFRAMSLPSDFEQIIDRIMAVRLASKVEVKENNKACTITAELPGLEEKDLKVHVDDDRLTISGEKKVEQSDDKTHYSERSYGSFSRSFTLPADAEGSTVAARFAKGVLTVEIAKAAKPSPRVRQVEVKGA